MPRPSLRTRTVKRRNLRTPGSRSVIHYNRDSRPSDARCSACGAILAGVPRLKPSKMANVSRSSKRPSRPYGGYLCPTCLASRIRAKVLEEEKAPQKVSGKKQK
jgi:large subunit ribosomal protein L34e